MHGGTRRVTRHGASAGATHGATGSAAAPESRLCEAVLCRLAGSAAIRPEDLDAALQLLEEYEGDPVRWGAELIGSGRVTAAQWVRALAAVTGEVPADEVAAGQAAPAAMSGPAAATLGFSPEWCRAAMSVPWRAAGTQVWVLTAEPRRALRARAAQSLSPDLRIHWVLTDPQRVEALIADLARADTQIATIAATWTSPETVEVCEVVELILRDAARDGASDVHIEPARDHTKVRVRIDGQLIDRICLPLMAHSALVSRIKVLAQMDIVERRVPQDGTFAREVDGRHLDIRVASLPTVRGEKIVLRLLPGEMAIARLEDLGMDPVTLSRYRTVIASHDGVILCAGPTGAGKTTTLIASLATVNDGSRHIVTIEDPVEYLLAGVTQVQTNERAGLGFANGLRALLRQDPDVLLVGEIRDLETATIAMQAALTGHLVFSSVHGTDAVTGLYRLIDMGVAPYLVASAVRAVVAQRLVRLRCTKCARPPQARICAACSGTGVRGRTAVYEIVIMTPQVRADILAGRPAPEVRARAIAAGMGTMVDAARGLLRSGRSSPHELRRVFPDAFAPEPQAGGMSPSLEHRDGWDHAR